MEFVNRLNSFKYPLKYFILFRDYSEFTAYPGNTASDTGVHHGCAHCAPSIHIHILFSTASTPILMFLVEEGADG